MKLRGSLCALAGLFLWANVSQACESAHVDRVQQERQAAIAAHALAVEAEVAADAHRSAEPALSNWVLLFDHEGESLAVLAASDISVSDQLSGEDAVSEPVEFFSDVPLRRFLVEDEDVATLSSIHEAGVDPETTGTTSTVDHVVLAIDGFEDR